MPVEDEHDDEDGNWTNLYPVVDWIPLLSIIKLWNALSSVAVDLQLISLTSSPPTHEIAVPQKKPLALCPQHFPPALTPLGLSTGDPLPSATFPPLKHTSKN